MGIFITWVILSLLVGAAGSNRKIGGAGAFFLSLLLSPIIGLIGVLLSSEKPRPVIKRKCQFCGFVDNKNEQFCPGCGKDKKGLTKDDYKAISEGEFTPNLRQHYEEQEQREREIQEEKKERRKASNRANITVLVILIFAIILLILYNKFK